MFNIVDKHFRKCHSPKRRNFPRGAYKIKYGQYALVSTMPGYVSNRQVEAARIAINRHIRKGGRMWIIIHPRSILTRKPAETRMGSGKGSPEVLVANVSSGNVLFEVQFPNKETAIHALKMGMHKLSVRCKVMERDDWF